MKTQNGEAKPTNGSEQKPATSDAKPARATTVKVKPAKPAGKAAKIAKLEKKPARVPVALGVLKKLAASHGKVRITGARDQKLNGRSFEVVSVAEVPVKTFHLGYYLRVRVGDTIRNVSPQSVTVA